MKKLSFIFILVVCSLILSCESNADSKNQDLSLQEKVEASLLLRDLDQFNASLFIRRDVARHFDLNTNTVIAEPQTRINWRQCFLADALGAWRGGKAGAMYGSTLSPSGAIAGGLLVGLLSGVACSGVDAWVQGGYSTVSNPSDDNSKLGDLIQTGLVLDAEVVYDLYCKIPVTELIKIKEELGLDLAIDATVQIVGVAHNALLDEILTYDGNLSEFAEVNSCNTAGDKLFLTGSDISQDAVVDAFQDDFSAQLVRNSMFKVEFSNIVNNQLTKSQEGSYLEEANSIPEYIMNLFLEATSLYAVDSNDITSIVNYYHSQIEPSTELSQEEKTSIYIGMVVAAYSVKYWDQCTY